MFMVRLFLILKVDKFYPVNKDAKESFLNVNQWLHLMIIINSGTRLRV